MYLPDINFWLAMAFAAHVHHQSARKWFAGLPQNGRCFFCRFTQQGFLRLANNPKAFPNLAVTQPEAWKVYDGFVSHRLIEFASERSTLETFWRQFTQLPRLSPQRWIDAYLAAFAVASSFEVVSFDKGFSQYANLRYTILT
ncbi:MAG: TA system VapC family ribonuclease toxin [Candidatus Korobacteraceae bacterium]